jgi:hypothetical protein
MSIQQVAPPPEHDPLKRHLVETSFESCTKFKEILDSTPIYNFINISIKPLDSKSEQIKRFKENVFVIDLDVIDSHFHFLNDVIGQFLLLKEHIPDIFPVILIRSPISVKRARSKIPNSKSRLSNFIYDLLSKIKDLNVEITDINNYKEVIIENSFAISTERTSQYTIKSELFGLAGHSPELTVPLIQRALGLDFKAVPKNKVFITRMHENNKTRRMKKTLEYWSLKDLKEKEKYKNKIGYSNYKKIVSLVCNVRWCNDIRHRLRSIYWNCILNSTSCIQKSTSAHIRPRQYTENRYLRANRSMRRCKSFFNYSLQR